MPRQTWQVGDRVVVRLPEHAERGRGGGPRMVDVSGTVEDVNPRHAPGAPVHSVAPPGVVVRLDAPVSGADRCFATHEELRRLGER